MLLRNANSHLSSGLSWIGKKAKAKPPNPVESAIGHFKSAGSGANLKIKKAMNAPPAR